MKKILAFLIFNLLIINPSQADNISDFQIEEMSLGDSVLNFMNEKDFLKFTWIGKVIGFITDVIALYRF